MTEPRPASLLDPATEPGRTLVDRQLIAVLVIDDAENALPLAEALLAGGVDVMELTLRTPVALEAAGIIREKLPEMTVGLGTVLTEEQIAAASDAGARFAVSPGVNVSVIRRARELSLPFAPGVMTPTDVDTALREGCRLLKFFPATSAGGLAHLGNIAAPFAHLDPRFIPLGGVKLDNLLDWLAHDRVAAVGGSWLAPRDLVRSGDWRAVERNAREARQRIDG